MKAAIRYLLLLAMLAPLLAMAQAAAPASVPLPAWDQLTPAQRDALIAPLSERWNGEPAERARMLKRAERWQAMPASQRERARHGMQRWEGMAPQKRTQARSLFHAMRDMDEAQRKAFLAQWRQMTPQQRNEWLAAHPAPKRQRPESTGRERQE